jgi:hypothetical protein
MRALEEQFEGAQSKKFDFVVDSRDQGRRFVPRNCWAFPVSCSEKEV